MFLLHDLETFVQPRITVCMKQLKKWKHSYAWYREQLKVTHFSGVRFTVAWTMISWCSCLDGVKSKIK